MRVAGCEVIAACLAGRLQARPPSREGGEGADEQGAPEARRGPTRPPRPTTTVAPPTGAPPGPVLAQVTKLPQDNDGGDEKPEPKPDTAKDTETKTATAEPPTNQ
jgi:hypothetical protein